MTQSDTLADQPLRIEDYALIGDCLTGALVGRNGSIDWLCWPRFDSGACLAKLLGTSRNGSWQICPVDPAPKITRGYRGDTMVLETLFDTPDGSVALIDFMPCGYMPCGYGDSSLVRRVEGRRGRVPVRMLLTLRFDYGSATPWVTRLDNGDGEGINAVLGPNRVVLRTRVPLEGKDNSTTAEFSVGEGETIDFVLAWGASHLPIRAPIDAGAALAETERFWRGWSSRCQYEGRWKQPVLRSLLTLKALTYAPTGGIVAAPTTSLPEKLGGTRNWDYRYCWLRDATLTLFALLETGYTDEAIAWRDWAQRAVAGNPGDLQIMYGLAGERLLNEWSPSWLPGYQGAAPVRVGNAASEQLQLDVYGEVMGTLHLARANELVAPRLGWEQQDRFVEHLESIWDQPDDGIWEVRGGRRHFTYSKIMAWVGMDRSIRDAEAFKVPAPLDRWRGVRDRIHAEICAKGFDPIRNTFTQSFGRSELDASLLLIPQVGFLPAHDPRVRGAVEAVERELLVDGFVMRYRTEAGADGLPPGEGMFLPCSFWLADAYTLLGRKREASALFERVIALANDVGLLAEEYDP